LIQNILIYYKALLEYIYCDEVYLTEGVAVALLQIADKYRIPQLKSICSNFLTCLTGKNVVDISIFANTAGSTDLEKATVKFIKENLEAVFKSSDIKRLAYSTLFDICREKIN